MKIYPARNRFSIAGDIFAQIRAKILDGRIPRGAILRESTMAQEYSASRTPVRKALIELAKEGLVEHHSRGWLVTALSENEMRDLAAVRAVFESHAAGLAVTELETTDHQELESMLSAMDLALENRNLRLFVELGCGFHAKIYRACPNRRLVAIIDDLLGRYPNLILVPVQQIVERHHREHYRIMEAIVARKPDRIRQLVYEHYTQLFDYLVSVDGVSGQAAVCRL